MSTLSVMPGHQTLRYRAALRLSYSVALLYLLEYARRSKDDFEFGPMDLDALEGQGLLVSGTKLDGAREVLGEVPGLYLSEE